MNHPLKLRPPRTPLGEECDSPAQLDQPRIVVVERAVYHRAEALPITVVGLDFEIGADISGPVRLALESLAGRETHELIVGAPL
jgi:hypothetical protein